MALLLVVALLAERQGKGKQVGQSDGGSASARVPGGPGGKVNSGLVTLWPDGVTHMTWATLLTACSR